MVLLTFCNKRANGQTRFLAAIVAALMLIVAAAQESIGGMGTVRFIIEEEKGWRFSGDCTDLTSFTIPDNVTEIGDRAFRGCNNLKSVTIHDKVDSISEFAFWNMGPRVSRSTVGSREIFYNTNYCSLASIEVAVNNAHYSSKDGVLFNKDKTVLIKYPPGRQGAYTIPNSVTHIGFFAFANSTYLTSITIPPSVIFIDQGAFHSCTVLTSITVQNPIPPELQCDIHPFRYINRNNVCFYVPKNSIAAYRAAEYWNEFKCIKEIESVPEEE